MSFSTLTDWLHQNTGKVISSEILKNLHADEYHNLEEFLDIMKRASVHDLTDDLLTHLGFDLDDRLSLSQQLLSSS